MRRGDVLRLRLPKQRGKEQHGARYGVVVQADALLRLSTVVIAPTSTSCSATPLRPEITVRGRPTLVMVDQVRAVDLERLGDLAAHLELAELEAIDEALRLVLGLR